MVVAFAYDFVRVFAWYAGVAFVVGVAEHLWPAGPTSGLERRLFNFSIAALNAILLAGLMQLMAWLPNALATHGLIGVVFGGWAPQTIGGLVLATLVVALVWDFFQYWTHRLQHAVKALWYVHALHHDDGHCNATTSLRRTLGEHVVDYALITTPTIIVCGTQLLPLYGAILLFQTWGFINHANVRLDLGRFTILVSGPQWHRVHHGKAAEYCDSNFAAFFPIIDFIFGTYRAPRKNEFADTGVHGRPEAGGGLMAIVAAVFTIPSRKTTHALPQQRLLSPGPG